MREGYISRSELEAIQQDFETSITQNSTEIRFDFTQVTDEIKGTVADNQSLLEEYIRFKGALIELGRVGNAFTAELSGESLAFKENGKKIAYISNQSLVITNAEIRNKLSLGNESRGWFDFIPRANGNLSIKWRSTCVTEGGFYGFKRKFFKFNRERALQAEGGLEPGAECICKHINYHMQAVSH